jgi:hypothetical protein
MTLAIPCFAPAAIPVAPGFFFGVWASVCISGSVGRCSCGPSRTIAGKAPRLVADSRFGPGENGVRVIERSPIPPAIDWRAFSLRRRADSVEGPVTNRIAVVAEKLADLLARETPFSELFN